MKNWILVGALAGFLMGAGVGFAHEGEAHAPGGVSGAASASGSHEHGGVQTITGEVVDLACYLGHGEMGPAHRDCAQKCIASGLPVGIKSGDTIYLVMTGEHGPANATLAPLAAKQVTVEGEVSERNGIHLLAAKKITPKG